MTNSDKLIELNNLSVNYSDKNILDGISLEISKGEHIALIGPSGVGKTTLLKKIYQMLGSDVSFIHQNFSLVPQLSVFHNIFIGRLDFNSTFYNLINLAVPLKKEKKKIEEITSLLDINKYLFTKTANLSGGQQQRVAIGRTLYRKSSVILADEPVSSLDPAKSKNVLNILTTKNHTTISALHNIKHAKEFFTRFIGIKDRKILFDLSKEDVTERNLSDLYKK